MTTATIPLTRRESQHLALALISIESHITELQAEEEQSRSAIGARLLGRCHATHAALARLANIDPMAAARWRADARAAGQRRAAWSTRTGIPL